MRVDDVLFNRVGTEPNPADYFTKEIGAVQLNAAIPMLTGSAGDKLSPGLRDIMPSTPVSSGPLPDTRLSEEDRSKLQAELNRG
jgi:hypothetical protein